MSPLSNCDMLVPNDKTSISVSSLVLLLQLINISVIHNDKQSWSLIAKKKKHKKFVLKIKNMYLTYQLPAQHNNLAAG